MLKANCQPVRVSQFFKRKRLQKGKAMYLSQAREGLRQFFIYNSALNDKSSNVKCKKILAKHLEDIRIFHYLCNRNDGRQGNIT